MADYYYTILIEVRGKDDGLLETYEGWHLNDHTLNCISDDIAELMKEEEDD
jgi:hypothetical protein